MNHLTKVQAFRALHEEGGAFLIPNPWDVGSAKLLAGMGFKALATSSGGAAFAMGKPDGGVARDTMLLHIRELTAAVDLPINADLENGYGHTAQEVVETLRLAAETGIAGGSIEDATGTKDDPIYAFDLARERIQAAAEFTKTLPFPFMLTARAENFLHGRKDLRDTIARLQAYQEAGADVLYAPGLSTEAEVSAVVSSVDRPVNVLAIPGMDVCGLEALGVKRISVGSALARTAYGSLVRAAQEMKEHGTFLFAKDGIPYADLNSMFVS
jgi:2-methylisocitrate lyase-like PEP mutase family enzyme